MRRPLPCLVLAASLALSGCSTIRDSSGELPQQAGSVADQAQFCYAVTRALQGVDAGSVSRDVTDAAEEVLAQAPDGLRDHARTVARALRAGAEEGAGVLAGDDDLGEAAEALRDGVRDMCEPRDGVDG